MRSSCAAAPALAKGVTALRSICEESGHTFSSMRLPLCYGCGALVGHQTQCGKSSRWCFKSGDGHVYTACPKAERWTNQPRTRSCLCLVCAKHMVLRPMRVMRGRQGRGWHLRGGVRRWPRRGSAGARGRLERVVWPQEHGIPRAVLPRVPL